MISLIYSVIFNIFVIFAQKFTTMKLYTFFATLLLGTTISAYGQVSKVDETKFKRFKDEADRYFDKKDFRAARRGYEIAQLNKPNEKMVVQRLADCNKKLLSNAEKFLKDAQKQIKSGKNDEAVALLDSAYLYQPENTEMRDLQLSTYTNIANNTFYKVFEGKNYDGANSAIALADGGIVVAGRSNSHETGDDMNINIIRLDGSGNLTWNNNYGADETEETAQIIPCKDGGFLTVGYSDSYGGGSGMKDVWLLKADKDGKKQWENVFIAKESIDEAMSVVENEDGTFMVAGNTTPINPGNISDVILIKVSSEGKEMWKKEYKEVGNDEATEIIAVKDGYMIVGSIEVEKKRWDACVIKIDKDGNKIWTKTYGGNDEDRANAIESTKDGGFVVAGYSYSYAKTGSHDAWVFKIDKEGETQWENTFGGGSSDELFSIIELADGSIVSVGYTDVYSQTSATNMANTSKDGHDIFLVKVSAKGDDLWTRNIGGLGNQRAYDLKALKDGSIILAGYQEDAVTKNTDILVVKTNRGGVVKK
jgi:hypothetical protein